MLRREHDGSFSEEVTVEVSFNESVLHSTCWEEYKRVLHLCLKYVALHYRRQRYMH